MSTLYRFVKEDFETLNPSKNGDVYIANQILKALNIATLKEEPVPFFKDVLSDAYYYEPVKWAVKMNITTGYSPEFFGPEDGCTRAQVVTFLWRAAGKPTPKSTETTFTDLADGAYYTDAVLWAVENGTYISQ